MIHPRRILVPLTLIFVASLFFFLTVQPASSFVSAESDPLAAAWARAQARGSYRFASDVTQTTVPQATLANIGSTSRAPGKTKMKSQEQQIPIGYGTSTGSDCRYFHHSTICQ